MYIDVHTHLADERFTADLPSVIDRAIQAGLGAIVVNGTCPDTNRATLDLANQYPVIKAAIGIYPVYAVGRSLPADFVLDIPRFDPAPEIAFVREQAQLGNLVAIGEIGLDGHWVGADTFAEQERVLSALLQIAREFDLPAILHTRKCEARAFELIKQLGVKRACFHCFGGPLELARQCADAGYSLSIPANAQRNKSFTRMLETLPLDKILTETDAPYLSPFKGERNEPRNVVGTVEWLAVRRGMTVEAARDQIADNYRVLFRQ